MVACVGKSTTVDAFDDAGGAAPTEVEKNEACDVSLTHAHDIIRQGSEKKPFDAKTASACDDGDILKVSDQIKCSLRLGSALWAFDSTVWGGGHSGKRWASAIESGAGRFEKPEMSPHR